MVKNNKNERKVIIFDYDGTIVDSSKVVTDAFNKIADKYGIKKLKDNNDFKKLYESNVYDSIIKRGLDKSKLDIFFDDWRLPYLKNVNQVEIFAGMKEVIEKLAKNNEIYVITSNSTDAILGSLKKLNIDCIKKVLGGDVEKSKVVKINMLKKENKGRSIFYIGDTLGDMLEAKKAKVKSIAVTWGVHSKNRLAEANPDYIVNQPQELLEVLL